MDFDVNPCIYERMVMLHVAQRVLIALTGSLGHILAPDLPSTPGGFSLTQTDGFQLTISDEHVPTQ
jgi:hypothetical protein